MVIIVQFMKYENENARSSGICVTAYRSSERDRNVKFIKLKIYKQCKYVDTV